MAFRWSAASGAKVAALSEAKSGAFVAIVGPSGAGKDSLIAYARKELEGDPSFLFVRRVVTRIADSNAEDHDSLSVQDFVNAWEQGEFCVTWQAHGLWYGLPKSILYHVANGGVAIANCSRAALPQIAASFVSLQVVLVSASPAVLAQRLAGRGRETAAEIESRLMRQVDDFAGRENAEIIDNSFALEEAGARMVAILRGKIAQR